MKPTGQDISSEQELLHRADKLAWRTLVAALWPQIAPERKQLVGASLAYLAHALLVALPPLLIQQLLDQAISGRDGHLFGQLLLLYGLVCLGEWLTGWLAEWWMGSMGQRATARLRQRLLDHIMGMDARFFSGSSSGKLLSRMIQDVDAMAELFTSGTISMIADILGGVTVFLLMWYTSPLLTCAVLLVLLPLMLGVRALQQQAQKLFGQIRQQLAEINGFLVEYVSNIDVIQAFGQEARVVRTFQKVQQPFTRIQQRANGLDAAIYTLVDSLGIITTAAMLAIGASYWLQDQMAVGVVVAMIHATRRLFVPIRDAAGKYTMLQAAWVAARRVVALLQIQPSLKEGQLDLLTPLAPKVGGATPGYEVELRHVYFRYQSTSPTWTLQDICMQIKEGERIALVGATGSGKTTLLALLARLYDPEQGEVLLGQYPLHTLRWSTLRHAVVLLLQDPFFFTGSIEENLRLGGRISTHQLEQAVEIMELGPFLQAFPQGLATPLQAGGRNLSSGQRQLLALIRAFACQPRLILLDEATSQVDMQMEAHVRRCMTVLMKNRTGVMVAHRLASIQGVDRIAVFHQGRLVEQGTHQELLAAQHRYSQLYAAYLQGQTVGT